MLIFHVFQNFGIVTMMIVVAWCHNGFVSFVAINNGLGLEFLF